MASLPVKALRAELHEFTKRSTPIAVTLFLTDVCVYLAAVVGAVWLDSLILKSLCAFVAGSLISSLFVIGHDAAHGSFTASKRLNQILGRIAFLPSLHNFSLWQIAHNRLHHRFTNFKGLNSWSPLSATEFAALSPWRRLTERFYRTLPGIGAYYLVERWWKDKLFPTRRVVGKFRSVYWWDFALILAYLAVFLLALGFMAGRLTHTTVLQSIFWGFLLPFMMWNSLMGFTVYLQHTNPRVAWFRDRREWRQLARQDGVTVHVSFPRWYGWISHDVMEHTAHHVNAKIPCYHIKKAQERLLDVAADRLISEPFSPLRFLHMLRDCKLYDYDAHRWLDFRGQPTSECTLHPLVGTGDNIPSRAVMPEGRPIG
jgi:omega-6 fatty acid desaturase (delta-12 desaturase)